MNIIANGLRMLAAAYPQHEFSLGEAAKEIERLDADRKTLIRAAYYEGLIAGIERYAHSGNGVQYVGTTGRTLEEARAEVYEEGRREGVYRIGTTEP